ncbi:MAG: OmpA family protein [Myxococcaceae bacterium]
MNAAHSWRAALMFDFNLSVLALRLGNDEKLGDLIPYRLDGRLIGSYQLHRRVELGLDLPFTMYQGDNFQLLRDQGFLENGVSRAGLGDLRFVPKLILFDPSQFGVGLAAVGEVRFPTGNGGSFMGESSVVFAPRAVAEIAIGDLRILANLGMRLRQPGQYLNLFVGDEITMGGGLVYRLPNLGRITNVDLAAEMHLATPRQAPFNFSQAASLKTPWEALLGVRGKVYRNWGVELDFGRGITGQTGYGREAFRVLFAIRYDFELADRDNDGIQDSEDKCPDDPEDKDGFEDADGCPDPDNDKDTVPDVKDGCPDKPGPVEMDGCPDSDGDEVPDNVDGCPEIFGPPENNGCPIEGPAVTLESERIRVRGNINFEINSAKINPNSYKLLDDVFSVLSDNSEIGPVLVEGHTDNTGGRAYNLDLSKRRAKSVVDYLVKKGVAVKRLKSDGFGFDRPVAPNDTPLGRAKNRRTEFRLVDEDPQTKEGAAEADKLRATGASVPDKAAPPSPAPATTNSAAPSGPPPAFPAVTPAAAPSAAPPKGKSPSRHPTKKAKPAVKKK